MNGLVDSGGRACRAKSGLDSKGQKEKAYKDQVVMS